MSDNPYRGAVVPLVTPATASGELDGAGLDKLIDFQLAGGVEGVFVLGTTGEGPSVPRAARLQTVERAVRRVRKRTLVYAGIGDTCLADSIQAARDYFKVGVDVVVAQPPVYFPMQPDEVIAYFQALLDAVGGPLVIYNIPATTRVSIPLDALARLRGHPKFVAVKDSENNSQRLEELVRQFGGAPDFSVFIGVGVFMERGLQLGAQGIVPSAGNLAPDICQQLCASARRGESAELEKLAKRMAAVATLYQRDRTLGQSLAALKAALHLKGICAPHVFPPLLPVKESELPALRTEMRQLGLLD